METTVKNLQHTPTDELDLQLMRSQLGILKSKLDRQTIVTDRLMHRAMKQQMSWISKYLWFSGLVLLPIVCISWWQIKVWWGLSLWSYLLLIVLTAGCICSDAVINKMQPSDWDTDNLVQTARKLARMKHTRKVQVRIQVVLLLAVLAVISYDAYTAGVVPHYLLLRFGIAMLVGVVIGGAIGLGILNRMQRTNDDIIKQIEELTHEGQ